MKFPPLPPGLVRTGRTLAIGCGGGLVFAFFEVPLAWMLGAMVATTLGALQGQPLLVPPRLRMPMIAVLGAVLGASFTPSTGGDLLHWWPTLVCLGVYALGLMALLYVYLRRVVGFDPVTAYFSAAPGGLTEMVLAGAALGGDERSIALMHGGRVLLVALIVPLWFRYLTGIEPGEAVAVAGAGAPAVRPEDPALLLLCAALGLLLGKRLRLPAGHLVGPLILSALAHAGGLVRSAPPDSLAAVAQVVVGCAVGARFASVAPGRVLRILGASMLSTAIALGIASACAFGLATATGFGWHSVMLAFAPGGLSEMTLIALALGIEPAFVATHHLARICLLVIGAPLAARWIPCMARARGSPPMRHRPARKG